ncbi:MAG: nucleotide sugar dehydrogenase [Pseudomonadales bacterium]|nr:nucleotide sugar dehydrogenase [Pseudomonadales bacterium]MBO7004777.1 nucleotide sugar dehydrogenase [Pseudomonadales bacterium]
MRSVEELVAKFEDRSARVGVVGLGYVGLPLALNFAEAGFEVLGFDIDPEKIKAIESGTSYFSHISSARLGDLEPSLSATTDYSLATELDALILCVPTPLTPNRDPDLQYVIRSIEELLPYLRANQVISLESTTYPGTTREVIAPRLVSAGFVIGEDMFVVYSPEREDPGNMTYDMKSIPKVCAGLTDDCQTVALALYGAVVDQTVSVTSVEAAEMTKLLENVHRAVNIGLVNEMKIVADAMNINIFEVIDAAATKPFGFVPYYPGPGLGGHCIPIDPYYLTWRARQVGVETRFVELAGEVNRSMPDRVVLIAAEALKRTGLKLKDSRLLVLGVAYKKNVSDTREAPAMKIIEQLEFEGCAVSYSDPLVPSMPKMRDYNFTHSSVELTEDSIGEYDAVILVTDHDSFDYDLIERSAKQIIDTRGKFRDSHRDIIRA